LEQRVWVTRFHRILKIQGPVEAIGERCVYSTYIHIYICTVLVHCRHLLLR
jgi:hypothetical protein